MNTKLSNLPNIGKVLESQLLEINIKTYGDLRNIGAKQAWLDIQAIDESAISIRRRHSWSKKTNAISRH